MKTGCVTLGQWLTLSGYRSLNAEVCWKSSLSAGGVIRPSSWHTQSSRASSLPLLGSGKAENFLVFLWFPFECFQRQPVCSTTVPRKLVHVGRSLPENEVICFFFIFCCLSPSTRVTRPLQPLPAQTRPARGSAGLAGGRGEERTQGPRAAWAPPRRPRPRALPHPCLPLPPATSLGPPER